MNQQQQQQQQSEQLHQYQEEKEELSTVQPYDILLLLFPHLTREDIELSCKNNHYDILKTMYTLIQVNDGYDEEDNDFFNNNIDYSDDTDGILDSLSSSAINNQNNQGAAIEQKQVVDVGYVGDDHDDTPDCKFYLQGACNNNNCKFKHDPKKQPKLTSVCKYYLHGSCLVKNCPFKHSRDTVVCKYWLSGECLAKENCTYSHSFNATLADFNQTQSSSTMTSSSSSSNIYSQPKPSQSDFPSLGGSTKTPTNIQINNSNYNNNNNNNSSSQDPILQSKFKIKVVEQKVKQPQLPSSNQTKKAPKGKKQQSNKQNTQQQQQQQLPSNNSMVYQINIGNLENQFPHVSINQIISSYESNQCNFEMTSKDLTTRFGLPKVEPSITVSNNSSSSSKDNRKVGKEFKQKLENAKGKLWESTGHSMYNLYTKHRNDAIVCARERNKMFDLAAKCYMNGQKLKAKYYADEGHKYDKQMKELNMIARDEIFSARNINNIIDDGDDDADQTIDLHGLHVSEAIEILDRYLPNVTPSKSLYLIIGTGHHSQEYTKNRLPSKIRQYITDEYQLKYKDCSTDSRGGFIMVYK